MTFPDLLVDVYVLFKIDCPFLKLCSGTCSCPHPNRWLWPVSSGPGLLRPPAAYFLFLQYVCSPPTDYNPPASSGHTSNIVCIACMCLCSAHALPCGRSEREVGVQGAGAGADEG